MMSVDAVGAALASWLLTYLIHSTILLGAVAVIAWRFPEHHEWLDLLWKAAIVGPFVTASFQPAITVPVGARWSIASGPAAAQRDADLPAAPLAFEPAALIDQPVEPARTHSDALSTSAKAPAPQPSALEPIARRWPTWIALSWLGMAITGIAIYLARLRNVYRTLHSATPVTDGRFELAASVAIGVSEACQVPVALAGRRIVVPSRLFELDSEQQRAAIAHELAHVARRDPEWLIAIELASRAFFFQPLNRVARAGLRDTAEFLCDRWAVRHTQSPLAMAKCLSAVAAWSEGDRLPSGVSAMARNDSAMIKRVNGILNGATESAVRPRAWWLAIPIALVSVAAPGVTAGSLSEAVRERTRTTAPATSGADASEPQRRDWTAAEIAAARAQLQVLRPPSPAASLDDRWRWALSEASRRRTSTFWVVYMFTTPTHDGDFVISDSLDGSIVFSDGRIASSGPHLSMLDDTVMLEGGSLAVLVHYRNGTIDRAGYRSAGIGFDFGRTPVFWLGHAAEAQSFTRVRELFAQVRGENLQTQMIELASMHSDSNVVIPFLTSLVEPSRPAAIRAEAAEGFDHHHDPRSVQVLLRVARTDTDAEVRSEAAETIGEVQTPESIGALTELVEQSPDPDVRREAAEAFGAQPAARAVPAIERVVASNNDADVVSEAIEALGELDDAGVIDVLVRIANTHSHPGARQEAVETLGDIEVAGRVEALTRLAWDHQDVVVQREAVETLSDLHDDTAALAALERIAREHPREEVQAEALERLADAIESSVHPVVLDLAARGATPRVRRAALESIGDSASKLSDPQALDAAQRAIARAIFDDPDVSVREEAFDALEELPGDRAFAILRDVIERHPDDRLKREAGKQLRERRNQ